MKFINLKIKKILLILLIIPIQPSKALNVIFDLGGVLFQVKKRSAFNKLGLLNIFHFILTKHRIPSKKIFFKVLDDLYPKTEKEKDPDGDQLPYPICLMLKSLIPNEELIDILKNSINKLDEEKYFKNKIEKEIIIKLLEITFDPQILANITSPIPEGINLLKKMFDKKHKLYVLSNWDKESFEIIYKKYKEIFDLFDGIVISGYVQEIKPNEKIYKYLLEKYNLDPKESIFIDDQEENIKAAECLGIKGIICKNYTDVENNLKSIEL